MKTAEVYGEPPKGSADDVYELPADLPAPVDDGACAILRGAVRRSSSSPRSGRSTWRALARNAACSTSIRAPAARHGDPRDWDAIPGARGCTPESCGFRDRAEGLRPLGAKTRALGAALDEQVELSERLGILDPVISDPELALRDALSLPTFEFEGAELYKRVTLVFEPARSRRSSIPSSRPTGTPRRWPHGSACDLRRGRVGRIEGDEIAVLDVPTMRECFERGGAAETGERVPLEGARLRPPIVPKKFFHTAGNFREHEEESKQVGWTHKIAPWIVFFQNVDALVGRTSRSSTRST